MAIFPIRRDLLVLTGTTFCSAALNLLQSIVVTRALGVENFGIVGLVVSVGMLVLCFVDFRIYDVTSKLYLADKERAPLERLNILHIGAVIQLLVAIVAFILSVMCSHFMLPYLTTKTLSLGQLLILCVVSAWNYFCGYFTSVQRLSGRVVDMSLYQLLATASGVAALSTAISTTQGIDGYCSAVLLSSLVSGVIILFAYLRLFRVSSLRYFLPALLVNDARRVMSERRVLLYSNLLGYLKLLSRAGDTLVVGALCNDFYTGLYRFARSLTDSLSLFYEISVKFYQPLFLKASTEGNSEKFKKFARAVLHAAIGLGLIIVAAELCFLDTILKFFFAPGFSESWSMIVTLSFPIIFAVGVNLWLWPLLISSGKLKFYTLVSFLATILLQYAIPALFQFMWNREDAFLFALGYTVSFAVTFGVCLLWVRRELPAYSPL